MICGSAEIKIDGGDAFLQDPLASERMISFPVTDHTQRRPAILRLKVAVRALLVMMSFFPRTCDDGLPFFDTHVGSPWKMLK